jgi:pimeloyl-ACP methyl ester carboxylesterase
MHDDMDDLLTLPWGLCPSLGEDGVWEFHTCLTPVEDREIKNLMCPVKRPVIPVLLIPGIMGTRLMHVKSKDFVWNPPDWWGEEYKAGWEYWGKDAEQRSKELDPGTTDVFGPRLDEPAFIADQGRSALHQDSYASLMAYLEFRLNALGRLGRLRPLKEDERVPAGFRYQIWGAGYNWLQGNATSAERIRAIITRVQTLYEKHGLLNKSGKVLLVTHSMGGLVARALCRDRAYARKNILGVVHVAQPAAGAAATYKRMRAGFEGAAQIVLGRNAREVTAVLGKAPGGLELLPFAEYNNGKPWLTCPEDIAKGPGNTPTLQLPVNGDPYTDIYMSKEWYGLVPEFNERLLQRIPGVSKKPRQWFNEEIGGVQDFHKSIAACCHPCTYALWSSSMDNGCETFGRIFWKHLAIPLDNLDDSSYFPPQGDDHNGMVCDGMHLAEILAQDARGDGTVPADESAALLRDKSGVREVLVFGDRTPAMPDTESATVDTHEGFEHQRACKNERVQKSIFDYVVKIINANADSLKE